MAAIQAGQLGFGENYVQEAVEKQQRLLSLPGAEVLPALQWHFIGPIQSNKTRLIASHFDWVQSIDRLKIAERLNAQRPPELPPLQICLQVNIDDEASKSGVAPAQVFELAEQLSVLPNLVLRGLMSIPAPWPEPTRRAESFAALNALFTELKSRFPSVDTLSMGMTDDLELAIANGSTLVRVGTAIFGARK